MMRGCFSSVTAAMLALHSVLGCCWHHAHCCTQEHALAAAVASPGACHDDPADNGGTTEPCGHGHHGHPGRHECQVGTCVFMGPNRVDWQQFSFPWAASPAVLGPIGPAPVAALPAMPCFDLDALLPPLRRHLLDQVLLI